MDDQKLSKAISYYLRHAPHELQLGPGGWVEQADLLQVLKQQNLQATAEDLQRVTENSDKQRFSIQGSRIRANQGHSKEVDLELTPEVPPSVLYHGTPTQALESIYRQGLLKGKRHHVHLSANPSTATQVGQRRGKPVILEVDAQSMHDQGHLFYCSQNGVWLSEQVPPQFLKALPTSS